jgi:peptidoglycan-associated lipoprotein
MSIRYAVPLMAALFAAPALANAPPPGGAKPPVAGANAASAGCGVARVHFDTDSAELTLGNQALLDASAACLQSNQRLRVSIAGNTDDRGSAEYNQELGKRRAQAVAQYLEARGVSPDRLETESHGENRPLCDENNQACWQLNRRTTVRDACRL